MDNMKIGSFSKITVKYCVKCKMITKDIFQTKCHKCGTNLIKKQENDYEYNKRLGPMKST